MIETTKYTVKITIKELYDGRRFYDYTLLEKIKNPAGTQVSNVIQDYIPQSASVRIQNKYTDFPAENQDLSGLDDELRKNLFWVVHQIAILVGERDGERWQRCSCCDT